MATFRCFNEGTDRLCSHQVRLAYSRIHLLSDPHDLCGSEQIL